MENSIQLMAAHVPFAVLAATGRATVMNLSCEQANAVLGRLLNVTFRSNFND